MSWAYSGLTPNFSGLSRVAIKPSALPTVGQIDVAARLVGLGLERELEIVALRDIVPGQEVQALAEPLHAVAGILAGVGLRAFAPAPEHVDSRAQLRAEVHGAHGLLQGVRAHFGIVGRERAVLEDRVGEQVRGRHRHDKPVVAQGLLELGDDLIALAGRGVDGNEIVVVQVDAVRAQFRPVSPTM